MISLVLGSCISTVLVGKGASYVLAANHIVIAKPPTESSVATIGAQQQIDIMMAVFEKHYKISRKNIRCLHLIGGGKKLEGSVYKINEDNIKYTREIIREMKIQAIITTPQLYRSKYSMASTTLRNLWKHFHQRSSHFSDRPLQALQTGFHNPPAPAGFFAASQQGV